MSLGAYNLFGEQWDETTDASTGYEGTNMADLETFSNSIVYIVPTDDIITIRIFSSSLCLPQIMDTRSSALVK